MSLSRAAFVGAVAGLNDADSLVRNPEYVRGQVELASDLLGLCCDECRALFEHEVAVRVLRREVCCSVPC